MASIERRHGKKGVTYRVKIRAKGIKPINATFRRLVDARAYVRTVEAQIAEGHYVPQAEARRHTVADAIDRYTDQILSNKSPHTQRQQRQQLRWWRDRIGSLRLSDLTAGRVIECRDEICSAWSNSTANRYLSVFRHLCVICVRDWQWLHESPVQHITQLREPRGRVRFLSDDECERLLAACRESTHRYLYLVVLLALCTGCRRNEICRLKWNQINTGCESITLMDTKNNEPRRVPIVEPARSALKEHARTGRIVGIDWVFPGRLRRTGHWGPCNVGAAWPIALRAAGIEDFRFHDLRHTTASYLAMSGATLLEIAEVLGHRDLDMVRRYAHLSESSVRNTLDRAMGRIIRD